MSTNNHNEEEIKQGQAEQPSGEQTETTSENKQEPNKKEDEQELTGEAKLQKAVRCIHRRSNRSQRSQNGACRGYSFRKFRRRRR